MLAERTVRRLSIRAPADALARRAGFLIEDALRTASLPGDGAELLLLRRVRLPPFTAAASPQQVALRLEAACRAAIVVDGRWADDAALGAAPAVRFADALMAHLSLTRLILAGSARQAWCWPLLVKGYRPAFGRGAALRALALSLAALPEAPAALPLWITLLVADGHTGCAELLLALQGDDVACLQRAGNGAPRKQAALAAPARWQSLLDWSADRLGVGDVRHRWLLDMARLCGMVVDRHIGWEYGAADQGTEAVFSTRPVPGQVGDEGSGERRGSVDAFAAPHGGPPPAVPTAAPSVTVSVHANASDATRAAHPAPPEAATVSDARAASPVGDLPGSGNTATGAKPSLRQSTTEPEKRPETALPAPGNESAASPTLAADEWPASVDQSATSMCIDAATAAGGLLFLVPLLARLGLADWLGESARPQDLPQRIFATLLRRLPIADADPLWLLCVLPLAVDREADGDADGDADREADREAVRWLARCRRHLRRHFGIGLYSLVCRPARIAITATHVDVRQDIDAVDLRIRRAGLDIDPGWVPWLGRVLRFHYGREN
jgi:hypothetical protein